MKPAWDSLMAEYADSKNVVIADVDCTAAGKPLCEKNGVSGYPTIKYGQPGDLQLYEGERDLNSLKKFAEDTLGPTCGPDNLDLCDEGDKKLMFKYQKWDIDELDMAIEEKDAKVRFIEKKGQKVIDRLQKIVNEAQAGVEKQGKKKDAALEKLKKDAGYKFMKQVKESKEPKVEKKVDDDFDPELAEDTPDEKKEGKEDL